MNQVSEDQLAALEPFIAGAAPDDKGEVEIYCPMHADSKRSCSVNVRKGAWYCHAGCGGGSVRQLVLNEEAWAPLEGRKVVPVAPGTQTATTGKPPRMQEVMHWHRRLRREAPVRAALASKRGLTLDTMRKALLGWNGRHYTIPIFSAARKVWNVRNYDMNPAPGRSKIWNTRGCGQARLYPVGPLLREPLGYDVLVCEGEWDTLLALQAGHTAVTSTAGAGKPWPDEWSEKFAGLHVYICMDRDLTGEQTEGLIAECLSDVAAVYVCRLPFITRATNGKDLSDWLLKRGLDAHSKMITQLKREARPV